MKFLIALLIVILILLQVLLWWGDGGRAQVAELQKSADQQALENEQLRLRNAALQAEVEDLREGLDAIEERARNELGLIRPGETFYQVVTPPAEEAQPQ